jgi:hypothetical protein
MGSQKERELMEQTCKCPLKPKHKVGEHDWCCQICGGHHVERICPERKKRVK